MNIKKVDDKPMVIHTKKKPKLKVKGAPETKIKGRNILTRFSPHFCTMQSVQSKGNGKIYLAYFL